MFLIALLTATVAFATPAAATIKNCAPKSLFKVNALGFWPDPAIKNANSTISFDYTVPGPDPITAGSVKYTVTYNFIPLTPTVEDLCTQTTCPILPGTYNQSTSSSYPDLTGSVTTKIEWFDTSNKPLLCALISTSSS
jgi:hypothetical protein